VNPPKTDKKGSQKKEEVVEAPAIIAKEP